MSARMGRFLRSALLWALTASVAAGAEETWSPAKAGAASAEAVPPAAATVIRAETITVAMAPIRYIFDGMPLTPAAGEEGFIIDGTTYVPLRFMANAVNKRVHWDGAMSIVEVSDPAPGELPPLAAPAPEAEREARGEVVYKKIQVYWRTVTYVFDGVFIGPEAAKPGLIYNNRLYVPLRFFGEALGRQVVWDKASYTITVVSKSPAGSGRTGGGSGGEENAVEESAGDGNAGGNGGGTLPPAGGGFAGGGSDKPSYASLTVAAEARLASLRDLCARELTPLAEEYFRTEDKRLIDQGFAILAGCDAEFDSIVGGLEADLQRYGYDTAIVKEYRDAYERLKWEKISELLQRL